MYHVGDYNVRPLIRFNIQITWVGLYLILG